MPASRRAQTAGGSGHPRSRSKKRRHRRLGRQRTAVLLRWCVVCVLGFVGLLYYRPLANYFETRTTLMEREAEVQQLRAERERLEARLVRSSTVEALSRDARWMGLVREGERLFIVKGIPQWRRSIHSDG